MPHKWKTCFNIAFLCARTLKDGFNNSPQYPLTPFKDHLKWNHLPLWKFAIRFLRMYLFITCLVNNYRKFYTTTQSILEINSIAFSTWMLNIIFDLWPIVLKSAVTVFMFAKILKTLQWIVAWFSFFSWQCGVCKSCYNCNFFVVFSKISLVTMWRLPGMNHNAKMMGASMKKKI